MCRLKEYVPVILFTLLASLLIVVYNLTVDKNSDFVIDSRSEITYNGNFSSELVNINEATVEVFKERLMLSEDISKKIVELRDLIDGFTNKLELLLVDGMTLEIYEGICDFLEV